jgi:hypothetical protein
LGKWGLVRPSPPPVTAFRAATSQFSTSRMVELPGGSVYCCCCVGAGDGGGSNHSGQTTVSAGLTCFEFLLLWVSKSFAMGCKASRAGRSHSSAVYC